LGPALAFYAKEIRRNFLDPMSRQQAIALGDACRRISVPGRSGADRPARLGRRNSPVAVAAGIDAAAR
jgi:hypothetical protein